MMKGYTLYYKGLDVFFETDRVKMTRNLAREICHQLLIPDDPSVIYEIQTRARRAECTDDGEWINIRGENFGGLGQMRKDYAVKGIEPIYRLSDRKEKYSWE